MIYKTFKPIIHPLSINTYPTVCTVGWSLSQLETQFLIGKSILEVCELRALKYHYINNRQDSVVERFQ